MKNNLEIQLDENTTYTFHPFRAELNVRGVVTFETDLKGVDFSFLTTLIYAMMEGEIGIDPKGEYKRGEMELRVEDDAEEPSSETLLQVRYAAEIEGRRSELSVNVPERAMIAFWEKNHEALIAEGNRLADLAKQGDERAEKDGVMLTLVINALRFVSGEIAEFAPALAAWSAANDRDVDVKFPSILPMAA